jgi:hypothetical protein
MSVAETGTAAEHSIYDTVSYADDEAEAAHDDDRMFDPETVLNAGASWSDHLGWDGQADELRDLAATPVEERGEEWDQAYNQMMRTVQMIGGAVIGIAVVTIVVNEVLTTGAVANSSGPFSGVIGSLETTGVAAMSLLVIGLLVAAASKLMGFFGGGF